MAAVDEGEARRGLRYRRSLAFHRRRVARAGDQIVHRHAHRVDVRDDIPFRANQLGEIAIDLQLFALGAKLRLPQLVTQPDDSRWLDEERGAAGRFSMDKAIRSTSQLPSDWNDIATVSQCDGSFAAQVAQHSIQLLNQALTRGANFPSCRGERGTGGVEQLAVIIERE